MNYLNTSDVLARRAQLAKTANVSAQPVNLAECRAWSMQDGHLVHDTGRFFQVVGLEWVERGVRCAAPFLQQRETGLLATILRAPGAQSALLVQIKSEPGNVGHAQFAPTCQATASNMARVHGGDIPPYAAYFSDPRSLNIRAESLQSEQGGKFLGKQNRNLVVRDDDADAVGDMHEWLSFRDFQPLLGMDFLVNTDLRSVLVASNWQDLVGDDVFAGAGPLKPLLRRSFESSSDGDTAQQIRQLLDQLGVDSPTAAPCSLDCLTDWEFNPASSQIVTGESADILLYSITMTGREMAAWHQPFFSTRQDLVIDVDCTVIDGVLRFAFRPQWEPGLPNGPELGPTRCLPVNSVDPAIGVLSQVRQSDEGGRFFHDIATYRITAGAPDKHDSLVWLTLRQVHDLLPQGFFNNEARSALSLLLVEL